MDELTQLNDAIAHAEEVSARECDTSCGDDHRQLALWLRELRDIKFPAPLSEPEPNLVDLDDHRIRTEREFEGESMAYVEALWGRETVAFNAAVRDLEAIRRGTEDPAKPLRPPETYHEALHLIYHVRSLANDLARHFGIEDVIRIGDDRAVGRGDR